MTVEGDTRPLAPAVRGAGHPEPDRTRRHLPLPEAQIDRFLLRIKLGYPTRDDDHVILQRFRTANVIDELVPVVTTEELIDLQRRRQDVTVDPDIESYIVDLVHATREHPQVELGASPRAMLALYKPARRWPPFGGRPYVIPDDVKYLAPFVLEHRLITKQQSHLRGRTSAEIMKEVTASVKVPVEETPAL